MMSASRALLTIATAIMFASGSALPASSDERGAAGSKSGERTSTEKGDSKSGGDRSPRGAEKPSSRQGGSPVDHSPVKDTRSEGQKTFDRNRANADKLSRDMERERDKEQMRDKSHDGRLKVGDGVSVGGSVDAKNGGATVDVKIDTDKPRKQ